MRYITLLLLVFCFSSCEDFFETTLELEEPTFESQLALSAVLNSNETEREITLTQTIGLNENIDDSFINDAEIVLTYPDGESYDFSFFQYNQGWITYNYETSCPEFTEFGEYRINASTPDGRSIEATAELPPKIEVISAVYEKNGGVDEYGDESAAIDIIIADVKGEENFYKLGLWGTSTGSRRTIHIDSNDPSIIDSRNYLNLIASDAQFDGENYRMRILFDRRKDEDSEAFIVILSTISKDQYRFDKILESASENEDNPFTSPVQLYSNVSGGLGLFALENVQEIIVEK